MERTDVLWLKGLRLSFEKLCSLNHLCHVTSDELTAPRTAARQKEKWGQWADAEEETLSTQGGPRAARAHMPTVCSLISSRHVSTIG